MKILIVSENDDSFGKIIKDFFQSYDRNMIVCSAELANIGEYGGEPWDYVLNIIVVQ